MSEPTKPQPSDFRFNSLLSVCLQTAYVWEKVFITNEVNKDLSRIHVKL